MTDSNMPALLHSVVAVAAAIFGAAGSAIFLLDRENERLVFQAVAGVGGNSLVGTHIPPDMGVLGWVLSSAESIIIDDLSTNRQCGRDIVDLIGYLPSSMMAAPLLSGGDVLGLLVVLDPVPQCRSNLTELELLALFSNQAAIALRVVTATAGRDGERGAARAELLEELREFLQRTPG
ncbi:MAG TPA: GAF domain-containing protein [Actinophytocola sp.]|uniref:GAF domain-containing protein n=1 Tax=Actinophytocola sp. TaxID=1872138 RepID=UPI002DB72D79|nr:GAF domain-containing protein [Actinophytocola sp.]HEU5473370.1 GAF domain-containing protein [Actinophytocola sp.]